MRPPGMDKSPLAPDAGSPSPADEALAREMTHEHNATRAQVQTSEPLPELTWSEPLARSARGWADHLAQRCQGLEHRKSTQYGQNLAARTSIGAEAPFGPSEALQGWTAEAQCWLPGKFGTTDRCDNACVARLHSTGCGHYTQVVWRDTRELGCAYASCEAQDLLREYWVCDYFPAGNIQGQAPY